MSHGGPPFASSGAPAPYVESAETAARFAVALERMIERGPLLALQGILTLVADGNLVVRAVTGETRWAPDAADLVGLSLLDAAPAARQVAGRIPAVLSGAELSAPLGRPRNNWLGSDVALLGAPPADVQLVPLVDQGAVVGLLYFAHDASATTALQERIERQRRELYELRQRIGQLNMDLALANAELRRLDDAKSQFVSAAAHELRNPLASLLGYIELMGDEENSNLSAVQRQYLEKISRSAQRLRQLTSNLLDITRLDSNRLELVMNTISPLDLLELALAEMQPLFDAKRQRVVVKAEPALPAIWCDRARALQVLTNLLSNANKYTPDGGTITAQASRQKGRPFVVFRIRDTGIGIPADDQQRLFTRFYRAGNATEADGAGAGLGLSITQSLVRLHGGKIWFESKQGKGTSFYVTLPIAG